MSTIIIYIYMFIFFFFLYLLPMACEMKNNEVQTFLPGPEVVVPRYRFGDEDPKNHGICVYIYIYINKTRLSPITQFFKHNFLFLYRFHCYTDHQEFNITLHRNDVSNVTFP